jgi:hypothetical protein
MFFNDIVISMYNTHFFVHKILFLTYMRGGRDRDYMAVGFTATYAISAYHHQHCEFKSHSARVYSIQHYVMKFVSDFRQVGGFLQVLRVLTNTI